MGRPIRDPDIIGRARELAKREGLARGISMALSEREYRYGHPADKVADIIGLAAALTVPEPITLRLEPLPGETAEALVIADVPLAKPAWHDERVAMRAAVLDPLHPRLGGRQARGGRAGSVQRCSNPACRHHLADHSAHDVGQMPGTKVRLSAKPGQYGVCKVERRRLATGSYGRYCTASGCTCTAFTPGERYQPSEE